MNQEVFRRSRLSQSQTHYELYALKYGTQAPRTAREVFFYPIAEESPRDFDYFFWVARSKDETIVIDCGFNPNQGKARGKEFLTSPVNLLQDLGIVAREVDKVILTHLHYDHAGNIDLFPNATFYLQREEVQYCTGPAMLHPKLREHYEIDDVKKLIERLYKKKVVLLEGDSEIFPGIRVSLVGGHCPGLQVVTIDTARGPVVLTSDAAHYQDNVLFRNPFTIFSNLEGVLESYDKIEALAGSKDRIIAGHDPLVLKKHPAIEANRSIVALHEAPYE